jgi:hypothetical protein
MNEANMSFFDWLWNCKSDGSKKSATSQKVKSALYVKVIRACKKCGASGVNKYGTPVGDTCPTCGTKRPPAEDRGRVWVKFWS